VFFWRQGRGGGEGEKTSRSLGAFGGEKRGGQEGTETFSSRPLLHLDLPSSSGRRGGGRKKKGKRRNWRPLQDSEGEEKGGKKEEGGKSPPFFILALWRVFPCEGGRKKGAAIRLREKEKREPVLSLSRQNFRPQFPWRR